MYNKSAKTKQYQCNTYQRTLLIFILISCMYQLSHAQMENGAIQAQIDIKSLNSLSLKTFQLLEHEDFKDLLNFEVDYHKKVLGFITLNLNKVKISNFIAPSNLDIKANKKDQQLDISMKNLGFQIDLDMTIDIFGMNFMKDFTIGIKKFEYAIQLQQQDPETLRLSNSDIKGIQIKKLDTSGFIIDKLLQLEKLELNEIIFLGIKLFPTSWKKDITQKLDSQLQQIMPQLKNINLDKDSNLDLTSFTELISDVNDQILQINLAGWFQNSRIKQPHPLNIGEAHYVAQNNDSDNQTQKQYANQIAIHQSSLSSLLNMFSSTNKIFTINDPSVISYLPQLLPELQSYYENNYEGNFTYDLQISIVTNYEKPVVQISNQSISIGNQDDFGIEFAVIAKQDKFSQIAFKFKMNIELVLETYLHNLVFDLNIIRFDVRNVDVIADNCDLLARDYEKLFETALHFVQRYIDDMFKDGKSMEYLYKGRYAKFQKEVSNLEMNHHFIDQFIFIGF